MDIIQLIASVPFFGPYLVYIGILVAFGATVSRFLPGPKENSSKAYLLLYEVTAWCALQKGNALSLASPHAPVAVASGAAKGTAIDKAVTVIQLPKQGA